jgi:hypothetical protein
LHSILIEFGIPRKLVWLIIMCLYETYSRVHIDKNLSDKFPIQNGLKQGDALSPLLFNVALEYTIRRIQEKRKGQTMEHINFCPMLITSIFWERT